MSRMTPCQKLSEMRCSPLVDQPEGKLNQSRLIDLGSNVTRGRVRRRGYSRIGQSKLHPVEEVEDFRPEFQSESLGKRRFLEQGEVVIGDTRSAEHGIGQAFVAQRIGGRNR